MLLHFYKMVGSGSDFILLDNREGHLELTAEEISTLCHRRRGVGAYGLILVDSKEEHEYEVDYALRVFSADGQERVGVVNAARCCGRFLSVLGQNPALPLYIKTKAGVVKSECLEQTVRVSVPPPRDYHFKAINTQGAWGKQMGFLEPQSKSICLPVSSLSSFSVCEMGARIAREEGWNEVGTTVSFCEIREASTLALRTYDVGTCGEIPSTGDAVLAACIAMLRTQGKSGQWKVLLSEGEFLDVVIHQDAEKGTLVSLVIEGNADYIYEGEVELGGEETAL